MHDRQLRIQSCKLIEELGEPDLRQLSVKSMHQGLEILHFIYNQRIDIFPALYDTPKQKCFRKTGRDEIWRLLLHAALCRRRRESLRGFRVMMKCHDGWLIYPGLAYHVEVPG